MEVAANNVIRIPCNLKMLFRYWFLFLRPFHKLTDREIDVITAFTYERFLLSKVISDSEILDKVVMSEDIKKRVREESNITLAHFQVIMGKLRRNKVILDNKINPKFIPNISDENGSFKLMLLFDIQ